VTENLSEFRKMVFVAPKRGNIEDPNIVRRQRSFFHNFSAWVGFQKTFLTRENQHKSVAALNGLTKPVEPFESRWNLNER
jgi:hypothetical protein